MKDVQPQQWSSSVPLQVQESLALSVLPTLSALTSPGASSTSQPDKSSSIPVLSSTHLPSHSQIQHCRSPPVDSTMSEHPTTSNRESTPHSSSVSNAYQSISSSPSHTTHVNETPNSNIDSQHVSAMSESLLPSNERQQPSVSSATSLPLPSNELRRSSRSSVPNVQQLVSVPPPLPAQAIQTSVDPTRPVPNATPPNTLHTSTPSSDAYHTTVPSSNACPSSSASSAQQPTVSKSPSGIDSSSANVDGSGNQTGGDSDSNVDDELKGRKRGWRKRAQRMKTTQRTKNQKVMPPELSITGSGDAGITDGAETSRPTRRKTRTSRSDMVIDQPAVSSANRKRARDSGDTEEDVTLVDGRKGRIKRYRWVYSLTSFTCYLMTMNQRICWRRFHAGRGY